MGKKKVEGRSKDKLCMCVHVCMCIYNRKRIFKKLGLGGSLNYSVVYFILSFKLNNSTLKSLTRLHKMF